MKTSLCILLSILLLCAAGCARIGRPAKELYRTTSTSTISEGSPAQASHEAALTCLNAGAVDKAEQYLGEALTLDNDFGPAHNTLGKVYYDQKKFYRASWEFEYAVKSMPGRAEPLNNLGLVYESVERIDMAVDFYGQAVEVDSDNPIYLGNLLRARIRQGDRSFDLIPQLKQLIFLDDRPKWVQWAKMQMVKIENDRVGIRPDIADAQGVDIEAPCDCQPLLPYEGEEVLGAEIQSDESYLEPRFEGAMEVIDEGMHQPAFTSPELFSPLPPIPEAYRIESKLPAPASSVYLDGVDTMPIPKALGDVPQIDSGFSILPQQ